MEKYLINLWQQAPLSWAIIRTTECALLDKVSWKHPILEVGCGDGFVSSLIFKTKGGKIDVGIDINPEELRRATKTSTYKKLLKADITRAPFKDGSFETVFANGVLEHIPDLNTAISEISRILKPGGILVTTSPIDTYTKQLFYYRFFSFYRLHGLAEWYGNKINETFAHKHLLPLIKWKKICNNNGLKIKKHIYYNNPTLIAIHDLCLPLALGTKVLKEKTDKMSLLPPLRRIIFTPFVPLITNLISRDTNQNSAASILLIAQKS